MYYNQIGFKIKIINLVNSNIKDCSLSVTLFTGVGRKPYRIQEFNAPMSHQVKSLVMISQEVIAKHIEGLSDVGGVPYWLLKEPLKRATPQQLYRIERASPHLVPESDELWLSHCMCYSDLREAYRDGEYQDSRMWRQLYLKRYEEAARKRQLVSQKVKSQYSKIQSEKAARSIKVLKGVGPIRGRTYEESSYLPYGLFFLKKIFLAFYLGTTGASKLFRDTKKATIKALTIILTIIITWVPFDVNRNAIFHSPIRRTTQSPSLFYPSESIRSHQPPSTLFAHTISQQPNRPNNTRPVSKPIVPPSAKSNIPIHNQPQQTKQRPVLQSPTSSNKLKRSPSQPNPSSSPPKRLAAIVNYDFFKEVN
ncbi:hypothetical protein PHYBLDRAFT_185007 [Phycomyces blakesleeanus NRRL 1555(-)]|uniref:Elongin-A n=1 Tax=Phycomyces blakesleeanus (strain ATCC 8743b / DSM 1359 / FGSC 10004 / NBRC 33097 / NRRL 1555) TaxID=763407 RepID=A0A167QNV4_PHYB8|nr:hypothetical protein PHYBLDRAFT_185007 [Phycomyces blakesleeanus NRRL 1555(-)]OAD79980.1 hypothetical protein PHYBLDRAFT_185007 [Phycomyces blakesleeanus NRRL 1555(-)]|eukprot:XP_018298020.1 hypothetical protein PHYBLDRAFT_185007 [Phycomyces blakesleeanus NRRL 1555(-)]